MAKTFTAHHSLARISPFKARPVVDLVRGRNVQEALRILEYEPRRAAPMIRKVIQSALANASNDLGVKLNRLVVSDARVDGGPLLGGRLRFMPRAMGRAFPIRKRTCHILVTLAEGPEPAPKKKKAAKAGAAEPASAPAAKAKE
jgi:large subunit ribosomal protein L22